MTYDEMDLTKKLNRYREALQLIATPIRRDGTWNRDRAACQVLAEEALKEGKPKKVTKKMLQELEKAIKLNNKHGANGEFGEPLRKTYRKDGEDLNVVYSYLLDGDYELAKNFADKLDACVRDQIPTKIWDIIHD